MATPEPEDVEHQEERPVKRARVLVVDDSALMRRLLSDLLRSASEIEVVGTARDGRDAVVQAAQLRPDVVTLDVEMPEASGIDALPLLLAIGGVAVVMVSALTQEGADVTLQALELGAFDFLPKPEKNQVAELRQPRPPGRQGARRRLERPSPEPEATLDGDEGNGSRAPDRRCFHAETEACSGGAGTWPDPKTVKSTWRAVHRDRNLDGRAAGAFADLSGAAQPVPANHRRSAHAGPIHGRVCPAAQSVYHTHGERGRGRRCRAAGPGSGRARR